MSVNLTFTTYFTIFGNNSYNNDVSYQYSCSLNVTIRAKILLFFVIVFTRKKACNFEEENNTPKIEFTNYAFRMF